VKDRFPRVVVALVVTILALGAYGLTGCASSPSARVPPTRLPVMYEFSGET
jgi:hypothetical protein